MFRDQKRLLYVIIFAIIFGAIIFGAANHSDAASDKPAHRLRKVARPLRSHDSGLHQETHTMETVRSFH
ncbi:MAG: hypothetical protein WB797_02710 [Nocardioides sp.]